MEQEGFIVQNIFPYSLRLISALSKSKGISYISILSILCPFLTAKYFSFTSYSAIFSTKRKMSKYNYLPMNSVLFS